MFLSLSHTSSLPSCIYRLEAYWAYELCLGEHVRQYHEEKYTEETITYYYADGKKKVEGGKKKIKLTEYYLGRVSVL